MHPRFILASSIAILLFTPAALQAQSAEQAQLWLTVVDRSAVFAQQKQPLEFGQPQAQLPVIAVSDTQRFQPIE